MTRVLPFATLFFVIAAVAAVLVVQTSHAGADFVVTREDDPQPDGCATNGCTLREAVAEANGVGGTVDMSGLDIELTLGEIGISGDVTIAGSGPDDSNVSSDGDRIFNAGAGADALISGVGLTGADVADCGGAITNDGTLTLSNVTVHDNTSAAQGGGVCNHGTMSIINSDIGNNTAYGDPAGGGVFNSGELTIDGSEVSINRAIGTNGGGDGGGIANTGTATITYTLIEDNRGSSPACDECSSGAGIDNDGTLTLEWSMVSNNEGDGGAGLSNNGDATIRRSLFSGNEAGAILNTGDGTMSITNSTISGNLAAPYPDSGVGGITNSGSLSLQQVTIANNTGLQFSVGGLFNNTTGAADYKGTIFQDNGPKNCNTAGTHNSLGYNVFSDATCDSTGTDQVSVDADLGPLQDNGGPTLTHLPNVASPAINAGGPGCPSPDQRGAVRVGGCDAGAAEFGSAAPTPTPSPSPTPAPDTFPQGDASCNDSIGNDDILGELRLAGGLAEPDYCGRAGGCVDIGGECFPSWVDVNCDGMIDGRDALWVALHRAGHTPTPDGGCTEVGQYPVG